MSETHLISELIEAGRRAGLELAAALDRPGGTAGWLQQRWQRLTDERPLWALPYRLVADASGALIHPTWTRETVPVPAIIDIDRGGVWGRLNNRMYVFDEMIDSLLLAHETNDWEPWGRRWARSAIDVGAVAAYEQEMFYVDADGRHRAMMAAALGLPQLPAMVRRSARPKAGRIVCVPLGEPYMPFDSEHADILAFAGEVSEAADVLDLPGMWPMHVNVERDVDWWFDSPKAVAVSANAFRQVHPESELPAEMFHPYTWAQRFDPTLDLDDAPLWRRAWLRVRHRKLIRWKALPIAQRYVS